MCFSTSNDGRLRTYAWLPECEATSNIFVKFIEPNFFEHWHFSGLACSNWSLSHAQLETSALCSKPATFARFIESAELHLFEIIWIANFFLGWHTEALICDKKKNDRKISDSSSKKIRITIILTVYCYWSCALLMELSLSLCWHHDGRVECVGSGYGHNGAIIGACVMSLQFKPMRI